MSKYCHCIFFTNILCLFSVGPANNVPSSSSPSANSGAGFTGYDKLTRLAGISIAAPFAANPQAKPVQPILPRPPPLTAKPKYALSFLDVLLGSE